MLFTLRDGLDLTKGLQCSCMHLPDPAYITFGGAIVSLATAITGVLRLVLEKRPTLLKKLIQVY
jgi:hypothetical protein